MDHTFLALMIIEKKRLVISYQFSAISYELFAFGDKNDCIFRWNYPDTEWVKACTRFTALSLNVLMAECRSLVAQI